MTLTEDIYMEFQPSKLKIGELLLLQKARIAFLKGEAVTMDALDLMLLLREIQIDRELDNE